eukprot:scaffold221699_cov33-Tisochrysis_lutea.AAC.2
MESVLMDIGVVGGAGGEGGACHCSTVTLACSYAIVGKMEPVPTDRLEKAVTVIAPRSCRDPSIAFMVGSEPDTTQGKGCGVMKTCRGPTRIGEYAGPSRLYAGSEASSTTRIVPTFSAGLLRSGE